MATKRRKPKAPPTPAAENRAGPVTLAVLHHKSGRVLGAVRCSDATAARELLKQPGLADGSRWSVLTTRGEAARTPLSDFPARFRLRDSAGKPQLVRRSGETSPGEDDDRPRTPPASEFPPDDRPLFFVPGLFGSKLWFEPGSGVTLGTPTQRVQVWPPDGTSGHESLLLQGQTFEPTGIREGVYDQLLQFIQMPRPAGLGKIAGHTFWAFSYNWMHSNAVSGEEFATFVREKLDEANKTWRRPAGLPDWADADVINHSMGGLVTRAAMVLFKAPIRDVAYLASPHWGAPKAYFAAHPDTGNELAGEYLYDLFDPPQNQTLRAALEAAAYQLLKVVDSGFELMPDNAYLDQRSVIYDLSTGSPGAVPVVGSHPTYFQGPWRLPEDMHDRVRDALRFKLSLGSTLPGPRNISIYCGEYRTIDSAQWDGFFLRPPARPRLGDLTVPELSASQDPKAQHYAVPASHSDLPNDALTHRVLLAFFGIKPFSIAPIPAPAPAPPPVAPGTPSTTTGAPPSSFPTSVQPGPIYLERVQFNWQLGVPGPDALDLRIDRNNPIHLPEWRRIPAVSQPAAYSLEHCRNATIIVYARFRRVGGSGSAEVRAQDGHPFGQLRARTVTFGADGLSDWVPFELENAAFLTMGVRAFTAQWTWQWRDATGGAWQFLAQTRHRIYALLKPPTLPWRQTGNMLDTNLPWSRVLEHACRWAAGAQDPDTAASGITQGVYALGPSLFTYDCATGGASHYSWIRFDCTPFLHRLDGGSGLGRFVNCSDCATITSTFANAVGADLSQGVMLNRGPLQNGFLLEPIQAIGASAFELPCGYWTKFSYHEVAWAGTASAMDPLWDACLKLQPAPGTLPANMPFLPYRDQLCPDKPDGRPSCMPTHNPTRRPVW